MSEAVIREFWGAFDRFAFADVAPLLHEDFMLEWPQSGERIRGAANVIAVNENYPGRWRITITKLVACGAEVVTECQVSDGETTITAVSFFTLENSKIRYVREYWPDPMEAQAWRRQWVEMIDEDA